MEDGVEEEVAVMVNDPIFKAVESGVVEPFLPKLVASKSFVEQVVANEGGCFAQGVVAKITQKQGSYELFDLVGWETAGTGVMMIISTQLRNGGDIKLAPNLVEEMVFIPANNLFIDAVTE